MARNPAVAAIANVVRRRLKNLIAIGLTSLAVPMAFANEVIAVVLLAAPAMAYLAPVRLKELS